MPEIESLVSYSRIEFRNS